MKIVLYFIREVVGVGAAGTTGVGVAVADCAGVSIGGSTPKT